MRRQVRPRSRFALKASANCVLASGITIYCTYNASSHSSPKICCVLATFIWNFVIAGKNALCSRMCFGRSIVPLIYGSVLWAQWKESDEFEWSCRNTYLLTITTGSSGKLTISTNITMITDMTYIFKNSVHCALQAI